MEKQKKYDVFISSKSEDYPIAREICSFLENKGYAVFFAEKSIPFGADSLFKKTIDSALDAAKNMLVVCSNPEYLKDGWVYYEWNTFSVEILSGRKSESNILTVMDASLSISKLPIGLRSYQSLYVNSYQETICDYLGNPSQLYVLISDGEEEERPPINTKKVRRNICLVILTLIITIVLGSISAVAIARKTLQYEYDYTNKTAVVVHKQRFFRVTGKIKIPGIVKHRGEKYVVTAIGNHAFRSCPNLLSVTIPRCVLKIGEYAFAYNDNLVSVSIPESVTSISESAFSGCESLTSITIPESVTSIGKSAFSGCESLTYITIPNSVKSIGQGAFADCDSLATVFYEGDIEDWCNINFENRNANPLKYSRNFMINDYPITRINIPNTVECIRDYAFCGLKSLTSITIPNSVKSIGQEAFCGCESLTSITIPESVTSIGKSAFSGCNALTDIYFKGTWKEWWDITPITWKIDPIIHCADNYKLRKDDEGYWDFIK